MHGKPEKSNPSDQSDSLSKLRHLIAEIRVAFLITDRNHPQWRPRRLRRPGSPCTAHVHRPRRRAGKRHRPVVFSVISSPPRSSSFVMTSACLVTYADPSHMRFVVVSGRGEVVQNPEKAKELWSVTATAWFPGGPTDPNLGLIRVRPADGGVLGWPLAVHLYHERRQGHRHRHQNGHRGRPRENRPAIRTESERCPAREWPLAPGRHRVERASPVMPACPPPYHWACPPISFAASASPIIPASLSPHPEALRAGAPPENPATGKPIAHVRLDDSSNYENVVAESVEAFKLWRGVPAPVRGQVVRAIGDRTPPAQG